MIDAIFDIGKEVLDDGNGDRIADVVSSRKSLECEPHHFSLEEDGAAAVAWVDGGINLKDQVLIYAAVRVDAVVNARDNTLCQ